jgi:hypothetical protein
MEKQLFNTSAFVLDAPQIPVVLEQISVIRVKVSGVCLEE